MFFFPPSPLLPFLNGFLSGGVGKQGGGRRGGLSACKSLLLLLLLHFGSFGSFGSGCFLYLLLSCVSSSMVDGNGGYSSSLEPFVGGVTTILVLLYLQNPSLPPSLGPFTLLGLLLALAVSFAVLDYLYFLPLNVGLLQKGFWPWRAESTNQTFSNCDCCRFSVVHFYMPDLPMSRDVE